MDLIKQDEKLGRFTINLYIWYTKAMTAPAEYGTRCLYKTTNLSATLSWSFGLNHDKTEKFSLS